MRKTASIAGAVLALSLGLAATGTPAPPQQGPGCPRGYEKGSTVDFPQFAYADENRNGLICFRYHGRSGRARAVDDDGTIG